MPATTSAPIAENSESPSELTEVLRTTLDGWRRPPPRIEEPLGACVSGEHSGFLAVVTVRGQTRLVVNLEERISTDVRDQIHACRHAGGVDLLATPEDYECALTRLKVWLDSNAASSIAGTADSSTVRRKHLLKRIDREIESAQPHLRASRVVLAAKARAVVAAQHSGAIEAELRALTHSNLANEEWLAAIARFESAPPACAAKQTHGSLAPMVAPDGAAMVHAILVLRGTTSS
jgi:hypothetical protein